MPERFHIGRAQLKHENKIWPKDLMANWLRVGYSNLKQIIKTNGNKNIFLWPPIELSSLVEYFQ